MSSIEVHWLRVGLRRLFSIVALLGALGACGLLFADDQHPSAASTSRKATQRTRDETPSPRAIGSTSKSPTAKSASPTRSAATAKKRVTRPANIQQATYHAARSAAAAEKESSSPVVEASCPNCSPQAGVQHGAITQEMSVSSDEGFLDASETDVLTEGMSSSCDAYGCDAGSVNFMGWSLFGVGCDGLCAYEGGASPFACLSKRLYMRAELAWFWGSGQNLPTLVTTSVGNPLPPIDEAGLLDDPDTRSLFGGSTVGADSSVGIRYEAGLWVDDCRSRGILVRLFDSGDNDLRLQTDSTRQAVIARNFLDVGPPREQSLVSIAYPNQTSGSIAASISSNTNGGDLLVRHRISYDHLYRADWLVGYQTAKLTESLDIVSQATNLNAPNPRLDQEDHFEVRSQFHGAVFGLMSEAREGCWFFSGLFKLGLGNMERRVDISGRSQTTVGNDVATQDQGLLARQTNIGSYRTDNFVFVPELGLKAGYRLTGQLDFTVGYSMLRLPKVGRVSESLDPQLASNLSNPLVGEVRPTVVSREANFTLHSLDLGLQWAY